MPKKKRIYIAGPMRGIPLWNHPQFDAAETVLEAAGYTVVSPARLDREVRGIDPTHLPVHTAWDELPAGMRPSLLACEIADHLRLCDAIALLPGWEKSRGARMEKAVAEFLGLEIVHLVEAEEPNTHTPASEIDDWLVQEDMLSPEAPTYFSYAKIAADLEAAERKQYPVASGVLGYFPDAIREIAHCSWVGNEQHNPGEPLHWSRGKSDDHEDCAMRHFMERGTVDSDGVRHIVKAAWRMLAIAQLELERLRECKECDEPAECQAGDGCVWQGVAS